MRRLTISAQVGPGVPWATFATELQAADVLGRNAIRLKAYDGRWPRMCSAEGALECVSEPDIEAIAQLLTSLSRRTNSVLSVSISPVPNANGALCWVRPTEEIDGRALRGMLWEYFHEP